LKGTGICGPSIYLMALKQTRYVRTFACEICGKEKSQVVWPCTKKLSTLCSRKCQGVKFRGKGNPMYGVSIVFSKETLKKLSDASSGKNNGMYGRKRSKEEMEPAWASRRGKTMEEVMGVERAAKLRKKRSENATGSKNPAYGKVYSNGGRSVKGYYKGKFFRSLFEYSFLKHIENRGVDVNNDVGYECFVIPYTLNGVKRTYTPDFYIPSENTVFEVKPKYAIGLSQNVAKIEAAKSFFKEMGVLYAVVSEDNFRKIPFAEAKADKDIVFSEKTLTYFKNTEKS
jgi:hypothetical protein